MKFIDLFAGLGGFHIALKDLGHECVFACEIDEYLRTLYKKNFNMDCFGDITTIDLEDIPAHDILCAGFPCQPFSKAGDQGGFRDPDSGWLYSYIHKIVKHHKPKYIILENVPNIAKHNNGHTWRLIERLLRGTGYAVDDVQLSPHQMGIPQIRERIYVIASNESLEKYVKPSPYTKVSKLSLKKILTKNPKKSKSIPEPVKECLGIWQEFLNKFPGNAKLPSFPIWAMEFGATYPYEEATPYSTSLTDLKKSRGSFGCKLTGKDKSNVLKLLPSHARRADDKFPKWKIDFIRQNRELYEKNKDWIDDWKVRIEKYPSSFQKLEWNCQGEKRVLSNFVIQIRASGVRVKRPTTAPSLVAMTATQVPIIGWEERYMTPNECKKLQSMEKLKYLPENSKKAYEALGNAVNVSVCKAVAAPLLNEVKDYSQEGAKTSFNIKSTLSLRDYSSSGQTQIADVSPASD
ncbi:DNA cytosine methyltransferase [Chloroflexota bacterium]